MIHLTIDTGNTRTKWTVFKKDQIIDEGIIEYQNCETLQHLFSKYSIQKTIISSVSKNNPEFLAFLMNNSALFIELTHKTKMPLTLKYNTPESLGKDRIASSIGAHYLYPNQDLLVIDLGTCNTFDLITKEGEFLGGNISPGCETRLKSMHHYTTSLPLIIMNKTKQLIGKSTSEAMLNGVIYGISYEIEGVFSELKLKYPQIICIITGGWAPNFENQIKIPKFAVKNLVPIGLNQILKYNESTK